MTVKRYDAHTNIDDFKSDWHEKKDGPMVKHADYSALLEKCNALASENAEFEKRMRQLIQIINNADNDYCMCGDAMKNHAHGGCGHPTGMFDYHYNKWLESGNKTTATDSFLAEVRAQVRESICASLSAKSEEFESKAKDAEDFTTDNRYRFAAAMFRGFAAQLRQGAAL